MRARRTHRFNTHHDLAAEEKNLAEIRQDLDVDDIRKAQLSTWSASYIVVLALEFCPAPIEGVVDPRRELYTQLLVERAEEAEHLDDLEGGLPVEVDSVELFDQPVNERLDATRVLVVEYMLQKLLLRCYEKNYEKRRTGDFISSNSLPFISRILLIPRFLPQN